MKKLLGALCTVLAYPLVIIATVAIALYYRFKGYQYVGEQGPIGDQKPKDEKGKD